MEEQIITEFESYIINAINLVLSNKNGEKKSEIDTKIKELKKSLKTLEASNQETTNEMKCIATALAIYLGYINAENKNTLVINVNDSKKDIEVLKNIPDDLIEKYNVQLVNLNREVIYSICCNQELSHINDSTQGYNQIPSAFFKNMFIQYAGGIKPVNSFTSNGLVDLFRNSDFRKKCSPYVYKELANVIKEIYSLDEEQSEQEKSEIFIEFSDGPVDEKKYRTSENSFLNKLNSFYTQSTKKGIEHEQEEELITTLKNLKNVPFDNSKIYSILGSIEGIYGKIDNDHRVIKLIKPIKEGYEAFVKADYKKRLSEWIEKAVSSHEIGRQFNAPIPVNPLSYKDGKMRGKASNKRKTKPNKNQDQFEI